MNVEDAIALSRVVLAFGQVMRITKDEQGRPESDTTHTVMLALLAVTMAGRQRAGLDIAEVVLFALVHDLPETFAGDTPTIRALDAEQRAAKEAREAEARVQLRAVMPGWVSQYIAAYERQDTPEAQFVRYLDKVLPKLTHAGNKGLTVREHGMSLEDLVRRHRQQGAELHARYPEFAGVKALFEAACLASEAEMVEVTHA